MPGIEYLTYKEASFPIVGVETEYEARGEMIIRFECTAGAFANYGFAIERVIHNEPATVVLWKDGTKTVVKCHEGDEYDPEKGLLLCIAKKAYGNKGRFNDVLRKHVPAKPSAFDELKEAAEKAAGSFIKSLQACAAASAKELKSEAFYWAGFKAGRFAVHCATLKAAKSFVKEAEEHGAGWSDSPDYVTCWGEYHENTHYVYRHDGLRYGTNYLDLPVVEWTKEV